MKSNKRKSNLNSKQKLAGFREEKAGLLSIGSAIVGSSCCLLPLAVGFLGLGSGAFAVTMNQYSSVLIPAGLLGLALSYYFYFREARRCNALACRMVGKRLNKALLGVSTVVMVLILATKVLPWADVGPSEARAESQMVFQVDGMT